MRNIAKRTFALVLSFVMIFTSLPTIASASIVRKDNIWNIGDTVNLTWGNEDSWEIKNTTEKFNLVDMAIPGNLHHAETWTFVEQNLSTKVESNSSDVVSLDLSFFDQLFDAGYGVFTGKNIGTAKLKIERITYERDWYFDSFEETDRVTKYITFNVLPDKVVNVNDTFTLDYDGKTVANNNTKGNPEMDGKTFGYQNGTFTVLDSAKPGYYKITVQFKEKFLFLNINTDKITWLVKVGDENNMPDLGKYAKYVTINAKDDEGNILDLEDYDIVLDGVETGKVDLENANEIISNTITDYVIDKFGDFTTGEQEYELDLDESTVTIDPEFGESRIKNVVVNAIYNKLEEPKYDIHYFKDGVEVLDDLESVSKFDFDIDTYIDEEKYEDEKFNYDYNEPVYNSEQQVIGYNVYYVCPKFIIKYLCDDNELRQPSEAKCVVDYSTNGELDLEKIKDELAENIDGYTFAQATVNNNGDIVTFTYTKNKYTVTFVDPSDNVIFTKEDAEYGESILAIAQENQLSSLVERFTGWVIDGVVVTADTKVTDTVVIKATQRPLVEVKHFLAIFEEVKDLLKENVEIVSNYLTYAKEEFGTKFSMADNDDSDLKVSIKYDAAKVTVHFVNENKDELKDSKSDIVRLENVVEMTIEDAKELKYIGETDFEAFRDDNTIKGLYSYDESASFVEVTQSANQENYNLYDIYLVFKPTYDQHKVAVRYWYNDPYGNAIQLDKFDYKFTVNEKDFSIDLVEEMSDKKIPEGFVKLGKIVDKKESGVDDWFRQQVRVEGNLVSAMPKQFAIRTVWALKNVDGVYKDFGTQNGELGSEKSIKDWLNIYQNVKDSNDNYKEPNTKYEVQVIDGVVVDYTGIKGWTVTKDFWPNKPNNVGLELNNENVIWSTKYVENIHNFNINGLYDADGTKDGKVNANYYIVNADDYIIDEKGNDKSNYELYAENIEVELETGVNASRIAAFNAEPVQDEEKMIIWKKMILEEGQYKVFGVRLNQGKIDPNVVPITVSQKLPAGLREFELKNISSVLFGAIADKAKVLVDDKEEALRQADIKAGAQVIEIEAGDIVDLLYDDETKLEANVITTKEITSNYYTYKFIVTLEEQDLTFEEFKQNNTNKELAYKQAIANAKNALYDVQINGKYAFNRDGEIIVEEEATGIDQNGKLAQGTYPIEVTLLTDKGAKYVVKGNLNATTSSKKRKPKNNPTNIIPDDPMPEAGPILNDLRTNRPNDALTRGEFVGVLSAIFNVMDTENYKAFSDVAGNVNEKAILKYSSFEIVKGYCEDTFGPNDFITREQMYAIMARAIKFSGKASSLNEEQIAVELAKVLDSEAVSDWARIDVATAIEQGIVETDTVNALATITRAETADKLEKFIAIIATESEEIKD